MTDTALAALFLNFSASIQPCWWFADEHIAGQPLPVSPPNMQVFSNRCDIANTLRDAGFKTQLDDFVLPVGSDQPQQVYYRVSKEKALVHCLINTALQQLLVGGELFLSGHKKDGLHSYAKKAAAAVNAKAEISKAGGGAYIARICKISEPEDTLPDDDYRALRLICEHPRLYSKPGVFGWRKIDRGSALLMEQLPRFLQSFSTPPRSLADIGCGYGYLSVLAAEQLADARWILTDNNATATLAAQKNVDSHGLNANVVLADCADGITDLVDAVLCNPPFHKGFSLEAGLTERFITAAHRLLKPGGQALFVVNQFIPLERKAEPHFSNQERLYSGDGFTVVSLRK
ncbi:MAG: class I SAM-dependent methyltransferase [Spongiibacteraceae bacterium]